MLFLFNDVIVDVETPETHLARRWRALGCGDPLALRAREAIEFVQLVWQDHRQQGAELDADLAKDLASLIISKTGANAILLLDPAAARPEPRLTMIPETVLEALRNRPAQDASVDIELFWRHAA